MKIYSKLQKAKENKGSGIILARDKLWDDKIIKEYLVFEDYKEFEVLLKTKKPVHYYEIFLENQPCNYCQDLDIEDEEGKKNPEIRVKAIIDITCNYLLKYLKEQNLNIKPEDIKVIKLKSPNTDKKHSYHLIYRIKGVYFNDSQNCKNFHLWMTKSNKENLLGADIHIYSKNSCFRLLNSSKLKTPDKKLELVEPKDVNLLETLGTYIERKDTDIILSDIVITKPKKVKGIKKEKPETLDIDIIKELLECLSEERAKKYNSWNNLGILLYCVYDGDEEGLKMWKDFCSSKCPEIYNEQECNTYWENYKTLSSKSYSIGTLYHWANLDNKDAYNSKINLIYKTDYLSGTHNDVAQLFYKRFNHIFIKTETDWLHFNKNTGLWLPESKCLKNIHSAINILIKEIQKSKKTLDPEDERGSMINDLKDTVCNKLKDVNYKKNIISELGHLMLLKNTNLNNNPYLFAFENGVYDFKEMRFRAGLYEEFITITCGYNYRYESSNEALVFLKDIIIKEEIRNYFLIIVASYLIDLHLREEFFVLTNKLGNNGKSTLITALQYVFGNYFYACKSNLLIDKKTDGEGASPVLTNMKNKRFISYSEIKKTEELNTSFIKTITGGDLINGRKLFSDVEEFKINGIHVLSCNGMPRFDIVDPAIIRRLRLIHMDTQFVLNPQKENERLIMERVNVKDLRYSFFQLLVESYKKDIKKGLDQCPKSIIDDTNSYFDNVNLIKKFIEEYIIKDEESVLTKSDLMSYFQDKRLSREYGFYNMKSVNELIEEIELFLNVEFLERKKIDGYDYRKVLMGYKLNER